MGIKIQYHIFKHGVISNAIIIAMDNLKKSHTHFHIQYENVAVQVKI